MSEPNMGFSSIKPFPKGAVVAAAGEAEPRELVILLQGNIGVYRDYRLTGEVQTAVLQPGSFHGEFSLFLNRQRTETLVALSDVVVLFVNRKNMTEFFTAQTALAVNIAEGICRKLEAANAELEKLRRGSAEQTASEKSSFFPQQHGSYLLNLDNGNDYYLYLRDYTCPMCNHTSGSMTCISSRLQTEKTDSDLRIRYRDIEPLYYEIVTCPNCLFSMSAEQFEEAPGSAAAGINKKVGPYRLELNIKPGAERDTFTVFAGYYLALLCAEVIHDDYRLATGGLWIRLRHLYRDCDDEMMFRYATDRALEDLRYAYEHYRITEKANQRLCYQLGTLYAGMDDLDAARNFYHMAKTAPGGNNVLKRYADLRLEEIREQKKAQIANSQ